jgi:hypothetical protein
VQGIGERKATNPSLARDRRERDRWRGYEGERGIGGNKERRNKESESYQAKGRKETS